MRVHLKVKIKTLAEEARIIRREEKRFPGESTARYSLYHHRVNGVRFEARHSLLAYAYLRGRRYRQTEEKARKPIDVDKVVKMIQRFSEDNVIIKDSDVNLWLAGN